VHRFTHENNIRQPGEPTISKWIFTNTYERQPIQFILKANDRISDISIEIANYSTIKINDVLERGEYLKYNGKEDLAIYDKNWNFVRKLPLNGQNAVVPEGASQLIFTCSFSQKNNSENIVSGEFKTIGENRPLKATRKINN
jgi:hypothetical protein